VGGWFKNYRQKVMKFHRVLTPTYEVGVDGLKNCGWKPAPTIIKQGYGRKPYPNPLNIG